MSAMGNWQGLKRRPFRVYVPICVIVIAVSTVSKARFGGSQSEGITLRANTETLCALIGKMQMVAFRYSDDPDAEDPRQLEPYAVGYTKAGNILLFGLETKGYSKSAASGAGELPGWRNLRIDKIRMRTVDALSSTFKPVQWNRSRAISHFMCTAEAVP